MYMKNYVFRLMGLMVINISDPSALSVHSSESFSVRFNCFTIPEGTVVLRELLAEVAFANFVISPIFILVINYMLINFTYIMTKNLPKYLYTR